MKKSVLITGLVVFIAICFSLIGFRYQARYTASPSLDGVRMTEPQQDVMTEQEEITIPEGNIGLPESPMPTQAPIVRVSPTPTPSPTTPPSASLYPIQINRSPEPMKMFTPAPSPTPTPTPNPDTQPPVFDYVTGPEDGSTVSFNSFCFPMKLTDNRSGTIKVRYSFDSGPGDWNTDYAPCYQNVSDGYHTFVVQGRDEVGNMTGHVYRNFQVRTQSY